MSDVSALGNVTFLDISNTNVSDVSALGNVTFLDISYTPVSDVSALKNVETLNISHTNVSDISALINVKSLHLQGLNVSLAAQCALRHTFNTLCEDVHDGCDSIMRLVLHGVLCYCCE